MIKWLFKWLFRLVLLVVVLAVVLFLSMDSILRVWMEHEIHAQTGMDAQIDRFSLGLLEPQMTIRDLKLYNTPQFGGTLFLSIPEIHVEYDPDALRTGRIHVNLLRFNLGELDIVKNETGQTNIFSLGAPLPTTGKAANDQVAAEFKKRTNLDFQSIDVLNVSVGTARYIDLANPANDRTQKIGIDNLVVKNVKSLGDLSGLGLVLALRSGNFFSSLVDPKSAGHLFSW